MGAFDDAVSALTGRQKQGIVNQMSQCTAVKTQESDGDHTALARELDGAD
jgi:hypothetical protein